MVLVRAGVEETVERTEKPAKQRINQACQPILRRVVGLEQHGRQRWRQRQRVDGGDHRGDGNGDRELSIELAGNAGQKRHGNKHRTQHQTNCHNRARHFPHGLMRCRQWREPLFNISLHVLHHHNGIVDDNADGQDQPEESQCVDGIAKQIERRKCSYHGNRHGQQRNNRGAPGLQEQGDHQHHQQHGFNQGLDHRLDGITDEDRGVVHRFILHALRKTGGNLIHGGDHLVANFQRIGARRLENTNRYRVLAIQLGTQGVIPRAELQPRHIGQTNNLALRTALEDHITKFLHRAQPPLSVNQCQKVTARHGLGAQLAGGYLHILLAHGTHHIAGGQAPGGNFFRVQPGTHGVVTAAKDLRIAHTTNPRQHVPHMQAGVIAQVQGVVTAIRGCQVNHHQECW